MIIKVIAALVILWCSIYLTIRCSKLDSLVNQLKLDIKFKDAHIKQQQEKIEQILKEAEDIREELNAIYWKAKPHPEEKRSEILLLRSRWLTMREIGEKVWLSKSTISKYLRIWDSETRWNMKYPRPVMPKNSYLVK
jgi:hypothetical protein